MNVTLMYKQEALKSMPNSTPIKYYDVVDFRVDGSWLVFEGRTGSKVYLRQEHLIGFLTEPDGT